MKGQLILEDGSKFEGISFGADTPMAGEVVFATGMVGYPESFTDPSYKGQILILTYPIIGNYGVFDKTYWESDHIQISGLIVSDYIDTPSHFLSQETLASWLKKEKIPALQIKDTRLLTQKIRTKGVMLGKIIFDKDIAQYDPNTENIVEQVSTKKPYSQTPDDTSKVDTKKTVLLIDCGAKRNIQRCLLKRGVNVITVPSDFDPFDTTQGHSERSRTNDPFTDVISNEVRDLKFDAIVISNGPGDPKMAIKTIATVKKALERKIPILGVCLGNQILALAAGGDTYKLKFGHRSQNQPALLVGTKKCYITTQNHGFAVGVMPKGFKPWFINANDQSNEGIIHETLPFMSVQFHPEANAGPTDTEWLFDYFLERI